MDREDQIIPSLRQRWQENSTLEKAVIVISVVSLVGILTAVVVFVSTNGSDDVCQTPECIATASRVVRQMDDTINPCDDFYNFACGNFMKETEIPKGSMLVSHFTETSDIVEDQLYAILDEKINPNDSAPFNMVKRFYKACMNTTLIEARRLEPMITIVDQLGGWPVVKGDAWDTKSEWSWTRTVAKLRKLGFNTNHIIRLSVMEDIKNPRARMIYIDQAELNLDPGLIQRIRGYSDSLYHERMVNISVLYGADRSLAKEELMESINFEMELAKISLLKDQRTDQALFNRYTLKQVQRMYPYIEWVEYINALLPSPLSVKENEFIVVMVPSYFKHLEQLLKKTPKRTIANYLMWSVMDSSSPFLSNEIHDLSNEGNSQEARRTECIGIISGNRKIDDKIVGISDAISIAAGALYVRKYFHQDSKAIALEMVNGIRKQLEHILNKIYRMDDGMRISALIQLKVMSTYIGHRDELMDNAKIEELYKNLEIDENKYLESALNISKFYTDHEYGKLRKPANKTDWTKHAGTTVVNAFYAPLDNSICKKPK